MYSEGSGKIFTAIILAIFIAVVASFWDETLFVLRFIWDAILRYTQPILEHLSKHKPFS